MNTTITLDEPHFKTVTDKARKLNQTPEQYLQSLIDNQTRTFEQSPSTSRWVQSTDDDLETLFKRARTTTTRHVDE